MVTDAQ